jgi:hypothetical protein
MKDFDAFKILNISSLSGIDEIKKSFRKLILLHHPDSFYSKDKDDEFAGILIDAYKKALDVASARLKRHTEDLKTTFKQHFSFEKPEFNRMEDFFKLFFYLLLEADKLFYSRKDLPFYQDLISFSKNSCDKNPSFELAGGFLSGLMILINSRIGSFSENLKDEYEFENLRKNFISYITGILNSKNYLDFRQNLNFSRDILINEMIFAIKKAGDLVYKEEISSMLLMTLFFQEEDFYENIFKEMTKGNMNE